MNTLQKTKAQLLAEVEELRRQMLGLQEAVGQQHSVEEQRRESEERYRTLVEHTYDFVIESSIDGRFLYLSSGYAKTLGYAPDELLGKNIFDGVHPDDLLTVAEAFSRGFARSSEDDVVQAVYRYRHKNGEWRWFESTGRPFHTANGELRGMIVSRDITERKQAEDARQEEGKVSSALVRVGAELSALLNTPAILDHLCRLTTQELNGFCSLTFLWRAEKRTFMPVAHWGGATEQWEALRVLHLNHETLPTLLARLEQEDLITSLSGDQDFLANALHRTLDITESVHLPLRCGGELLGLQSIGYRMPSLPLPSVQQRIAHGITHLASIALENARLFEQAESANRLKSDFITTISHELRTPLHIITGYTDLLLDGEFGEIAPEPTDILQRIERNIQELSDIVNATLDVSRIDAGRLPLTLAQTDLADLIREIQRDTQDLQDHSSLTFRWSVPPELPTILTDPLKVKVVLKNLFNNAVKFTETGSITVSVAAQQNGIEISIADTGVGIAPESIRIIFEPFRQADDPMTRQYGGVGLGLYIVRRLLELLEGSISVESTQGQGSTFRVWLPLAIGERLAEATMN